MDDGEILINQGHFREGDLQVNQQSHQGTEYWTREAGG